MTPETREHLQLNPDEQRPLYRGSYARNRRVTVQQEMAAFVRDTPDWEMQERRWQEYNKTKSEYQ